MPLLLPDPVARSPSTGGSSGATVELIRVLVRWLATSLDDIALRDIELWRQTVDDGGGNPEALTGDWLRRSRPDTAALAATVAGEPDPATEGWLLDVLAASGAAIGELIGFCRDLEALTGADDVLWLTVERHLASDAATAAPLVMDVLSVLGIVSRYPAGSSDPADGDDRDGIEDWSIRWTSLDALFTDPDRWLTQTLGNLPIALLPIAADLVDEHAGLPAVIETLRPTTGDALRSAGLDPTPYGDELRVWLPALRDDGTIVVGFSLGLTMVAGPSGPSAVVVALESNGRIEETFTAHPSDSFEVALTISADGRFLGGARFGPDVRFIADAGGGVAARLTASYDRTETGLRSDPEADVPVLPTLDRFRANAEFGTTASTGGSPTITFAIGVEAAGEVVFDAGSTFPIETGSSRLAAGWTAALAWESGGNSAGLSGGIAIRSPVLPTITLGPLAIERFTAGLGAGTDGGRVDLGFGLAIAFGPVSLRADGMSVFAALPFPATDDGTRSDLTFGFDPPNLIEIAVDNPPMLSGGGLISLEENRYSGFLSLRLYDFALTAVGLLETNLPPPGPDFSLLVLISTEFPGIQIGYGLTLNGIGGIVGVHRTIDADALRADVSTGAVSAILDPGASLGNASELITRLERYFPAAPDRYVVGLSIQLRWIELVRLDVGVMIELPGPARIVLLGRAKIVLEAGDLTLVRIQLELLGILDFEQELLSIDAALRDSELLEIFQIVGGAAIRVSWGATPYAVMSIGGFHPEFVPEPAVVPVPDRVGLVSGSPDDWFYLRLETYFAVTTTSFQFGAAVEVRINAAVITVSGGLGFDALIVFDPFYFSVGFHAHLRVKLAGISLAGVSMKGTLSGPGPVTFAGKVCIEILFFDICWSGSFSIGSEAPVVAATIESVLDRLVDEVRGDALDASPASTPAAIIELASDESGPVFDPAGSVSWVQSLTPLGTVVERLEGSPLARPLMVEASVAGLRAGAADELDWFAPAAFAEMTDAEALNRKSFERLHAGFRLEGGRRALSETGTASRPLQPEVYIKPDPTPVGTPGIVFHLIPSAVAVAALSRAGRLPIDVEPILTVREQEWTVSPADGGGPAEPAASRTATSETAAHQHARHHGGVAHPSGEMMRVGDL